MAKLVSRLQHHLFSYPRQVCCHFKKKIKLLTNSLTRASLRSYSQPTASKIKILNVISYFLVFDLISPPTHLNFNFQFYCKASLSLEGIRFIIPGKRVSRVSVVGIAIFPDVPVVGVIPAPSWHIFAGWLGCGWQSCPHYIRPPHQGRPGLLPHQR